MGEARDGAGMGDGKTDDGTSSSGWRTHGLDVRGPGSRQSGPRGVRPEDAGDRGELWVEAGVLYFAGRHGMWTVPLSWLDPPVTDLAGVTHLVVRGAGRNRTVEFRLARGAEDERGIAEAVERARQAEPDPRDAIAVRELLALLAPELRHLEALATEAAPEPSGHGPYERYAAQLRAAVGRVPHTWLPYWGTPAVQLRDAAIGMLVGAAEAIGPVADEHAPARYELAVQRWRDVVAGLRHRYGASLQDEALPVPRLPADAAQQTEGQHAPAAAMLVRWPDAAEPAVAGSARAERDDEHRSEPPLIGGLGKLGSRGMTELHRRRAPGLIGTIARKELKPDAAATEGVADTFVEIGRRFATVRHPNVVNILSAGAAPVTNIRYIDMEYVDGESILGAGGWEPLSSERAMTLLAQLAAAIDAVHEAGLVHGDVRPGNVLIESNGRVVLLEPSVAADYALEQRRGTVFGEIPYLAPERVRREQSRAPADIYALGTIAFALLTGRPPFAGSPQEMLDAHQERPAPALHDLRLGAPAAADAAIAHALAKDPSARPPSALAFVDELRQAFAPSGASEGLGGPPQPSGESPGGEPLAWPPRPHAAERPPQSHGAASPQAGRSSAPGPLGRAAPGPLGRTVTSHPIDDAATPPAEPPAEPPIQPRSPAPGR